jgi:hypothetical protein
VKGNLASYLDFLFEHDDGLQDLETLKHPKIAEDLMDPTFSQYPTLILSNNFMLLKFGEGWKSVCLTTI